MDFNVVEVVSLPLDLSRENKGEKRVYEVGEKINVKCVKYQERLLSDFGKKYVELIKEKPVTKKTKK